MALAKLTTELAARLEEANASEVLDIIVELQPQADLSTRITTGSQTHSDRIAAMKETFSRNVLPVEEAIHRAGGEIVGRAWINQTVRARIPAQRVRELSFLDRVATLDLPHRLTTDAD